MELARLVEIGEAEAFADMYRAMPRPLAEGLGMAVHDLAGGLGVMLRRVDQPEFNRVFAVGLDRPLTPEDLNEVLGLYRPLGLSFARFQPSPLSEPRGELEGWLAERGMAQAPTGWTKRARATADLPEVATDLTVVEANEVPGAFGQVASAAFGMPPPVAPWAEALVGRPNWRCFVGLDGERPVSCGALFIGEHCGWLGLGGSLPDARGRGGQGAVMRARIAAARDAGKAWVITETGAPAPGETPGPSYRNMDRHGFAEVHVRPNYLI